MQITNESLLEAAAARLLQDKASPRADATDFEHLSKLCSQCLASVVETGTQHKSRSNLKTQGVQTDGQVLQGKPVVLADQRNSEMGVQTVGSIGKEVTKAAHEIEGAELGMTPCQQIVRIVRGLDARTMTLPSGQADSESVETVVRGGCVVTLGRRQSSSIDSISQATYRCGQGPSSSAHNAQSEQAAYPSKQTGQAVARGIQGSGERSEEFTRVACISESVPNIGRGDHQEGDEGSFTGIPDQGVTGRETRQTASVVEYETQMDDGCVPMDVDDNDPMDVDNDSVHMVID